MAEIYRAKTFGAAGFEKEFAIKLILPSLVDDHEFVDMFINEAKIAVSLYHANIVQVFDLGHIDEQYFIAMEFVHGKDLLDVLARCAEMRIKIPLNLVLFIAMEMLKGLDFAHRAKDPYGDDLNIIHRDVSPSNILISYAGDVKVGDFGVAKAAIERTLTESGTLKGKVGYMSPEQVVGEPIDSRSDVFSASIVFFEALSMNRLFVGNSDLDVMLKVRDVDMGSTLKKAGPLPSDLVEIVRRGLARHREERFQTSGEFYQELMDFCFRHGIKVTGSDLSNFMRRLFAEEIEAEKTQRRSEPGGASIREELGREEERSNRMKQGWRPSTPPESRGPEGKLLGRKKEDLPSSTREYRYRDEKGVIFGPMGAQTLSDLLRIRRPREEDRVAVDGGPWQSLSEVEEEIDLKAAIGMVRHQRKLERIQTAAQGKKRGEAAIRELRRANEEIGESGSREPSLAFTEEEGLVAMREELEVSPPPRLEGELGDQSSPATRPAPMTSGKKERLGKESLKELKEQYASYEGELKKVSFARVLGRLHRAGATGRLHVEQGEIEKSIYFRDGEPIFVYSNKKEELLGNFLLSRKLISEEDLQGALARLSEWGGRLGDALVAIGAIPAHGIFEYLTAQMREKLLEVFEWKEGTYSYYENQEPDTQGYPLGLETYHVIVEGVRDRYRLERIKDAYGSRTFMGLVVKSPAPFSADRLGLRARELRVLHQLSPGDTLVMLLGKFPPEEHELVQRTVYLLHQVELVSFEKTEKVSLPPVEG